MEVTPEKTAKGVVPVIPLSSAPKILFWWLRMMPVASYLMEQWLEPVMTMDEGTPSGKTKLNGNS